MTDERLRLIADMRDRLTPALRRLKTVMQSTGRVNAFQKLARDMGLAERSAYRLGFTLGRTVKYGAIAAAGGTALAGAALVRFGKQSADALDANAALAKQINFSADALRTLQGTADRYNVSQEAVTAGLTKFNVSFGRLKQGQGAFYTYLKKTNPALAEQFKHVGSTESAFVLLSDAIAKTADPAKRAALVKAAGLSQEFLRFFADGPDDLRQTIKEVIRYQGLLGPKAARDAAAYGDAMDNIGLAWRGLRDKLTVSALPVVIPLLQDLADFMANNRERIATGFREIAVDVGGALRDLGKWVNSDKGREFFAGLWPELQKVGAAFRDIALSVKDLAGAIKDLGGWKAVIGAVIAYKAVGGIPGVFDLFRGGASKGGPSGGGANGGGGLLGLLGFLGPLGLVGGAAVLGSLWATKDIPNNVQIDPATGLPFNPPPGWKPRTNGSPSAAPLSTPYNRSNLPPDVLKRAQDAANAFRADPEGSRGRMMLQHSREELAAAAKTMVELDGLIAEMRRSGADKQFAERFADILARRNAIAARVEQDRASDIGKKIGTEAGNAFFQQMRLLLGSGVGGSSAGSGGARVWNASYRPGGGVTIPRGGASSFAGAPGGMLGLIAAGEGTGSNYNETLARGLLTGGPVNLTSMTLDQIDALQTRMLRHPRNRWGSSAVGRYQFVRTRLRDLRRRYGIPGSALYSPDMQDALAKLSLSERGGSVESLRREWEGLRRVPDRDIRGAMRRHERRKLETRQKIEGSASLDVRFHNAPAGTRVGSKASGLFREVNLDTGRAMKLA